MGETPDDLMHRIEDLRADTTAVIGEIQQRVRETTDVRGQLRRQPRVGVVLGAMAVSLLGFAAYRVARTVGQRRARTRWLRDLWHSLTG